MTLNKLLKLFSFSTIIQLGIRFVLYSMIVQQYNNTILNNMLLIVLKESEPQGRPGRGKICHHI